ncbi:receptor-like serine/threonine-protein kinase SD1-8 [Iris pallida]|uniref:Receptor-like serine/threonine-protein kinase n=1 Tax=Iris pallida TaxID=29817 RepID=A0AAX6HTK3_IRIPA|nr:receptor-like serine/threonine-protein kinase SD1-8 [Iris pallida]
MLSSMASFEHNNSILLRPLLFITVVLIVSLSLSTATARDTITPTQPLSDNETLVSAGGTFALGFFTPNNSDDRRRYIGIWYHNIKVQTIVWVANRANPVIGPTGQLSVTANGTITITNREPSAVVWYSVGSILTNPVLELLETGNFVLREEGDITQNNQAWQSFDYPTDTLLPGMKLGVDKVAAGLSRNLTAWKSKDDPSPGEYYAAMGTDSSPEMYLFDRSRSSEKVWRSGPWDGIHLGGIPSYRGITYSFVNNNEEVTFSYQASRNITPMLKISQEGPINLLIWAAHGVDAWNLFWYAPQDQCETIGMCGSYGICDITKSPACGCLQGFTPKSPANWALRDGTDGCVRQVELDCRSEGNDTTFQAVNMVKLPESSSSLDGNIFSLDACRSECLKNCSCTAYAISVGGGGCVIWVTDLFDVEQLVGAGQDLYMRIKGSADGAGRQSTDDAGRQSTDAASHSQSDQKANRRAVAIVVSLISGAILLSCFIFFLWRRKKREKVILGRTIFFSDKLDEDDRRKELELPLFNFGTIAAATESFSTENKLGQGGFCLVYKGILGGDKEIAVKRLAKSSQQGVEEFKNEVMLIAKLQNRNLVRLLGCCIQGEERMLIYEYMPNRSLDAFLFEKEKATLLEWQTRYQIIVGITRGLLYLHHDSRYRIIHRDLKASNILLDKEMNPKISDFGMARLFGGDETDYNTRKVVGTYGYMSPEYAMEGIFSMKSDVYSFGVLLLEIISGKKNRGLYAFSPHLNLVSHAWSLWNEDESLELVDEAMNNNFPSNDVLKCIKIGLLCVQDHPEDRPLMSSVIEMLGASADMTSLPHPKQPGFIARMGPFELDHISNNRASGASNELTVTLDGR